MRSFQEDDGVAVAAALAAEVTSVVSAAARVSTFVLCKYLLRAIISAVKNTEGRAPLVLNSVGGVFKSLMLAALRR